MMRKHALIVGMLAAVTLIAHGGSLFDGLFFDDYWHRVTLREYGWGWHDLIESATFDVPGRLVHHWWQTQPLKWRYARPVAMLVMKLEWLTDSPMAVHAFALFWHFLTACLVYVLALWALRHRGWALLAGVLFITDPQSVYTVSWTAARNALVGGLLLTAAVVAYVRARCAGGWSGVQLDPARADSADWVLRAYRPSAASSETARDATQNPPIPAISKSNTAAWLTLAIVCWVLSLFSRETAIVFPAIALSVDVACGGWRGMLRRWPTYGLIVVAACGYLVWRLVVFPVAATPSIYFTTPSGPGYVVWAASKLMQLLVAQWYNLPMFMGLATYQGLSRGQVLVHLVMLVLLAFVAVWYLWASRGLASRWVWVVWCVGAFVPVVPVFMMPHFGYLPAVSMSIMLAIMLRRLRGKLRVVAVVFLVASHCWTVAIYRYAWRGVVRSGQLIYADILDHTPPPPPGARLLFVNLPIVGIYGTVAMRDAWHDPDVEGYVLTYAPHPLRMDRPSMLERTGPNTLVVSTPPPGYFSGLGGRMLLDGMRPGEPLEVGTVVRGELFDTKILAVDGGVTRLAFTFRRPLDAPKYLFYISTPDDPAARVRFDGDRVRIEHDAEWLRARAGWLRERDYYFTIMDMVRRVVQSDLFLTGDSGEQQNGADARR